MGFRSKIYSPRLLGVMMLFFLSIGKAIGHQGLIAQGEQDFLLITAVFATFNAV
jgi:hypothetical protein